MFFCGIEAYIVASGYMGSASLKNLMLSWAFLVRKRVWAIEK
jgi:hypothetical protein